MTADQHSDSHFSALRSAALDEKEFAVGSTKRLLVAVAVGIAVAMSAVTGAAAGPASAAEEARTVPIKFEGTVYSSLTHPRLAKLSLVFVVDRAAQAEGVMYAYRTDAEARARLGIRNDSIGILASDTQFWSGPNSGGDWMAKGPGTSLADLTKVGRSCFPFCTKNWNDAISSLETDGYATRLYQHTYMEGYSIYFGSYIKVNLYDYLMVGSTTWDDQASSLVVYA